jgi:hypothetical protein
MPGLFIGILLMASLLLVHFSTRTQPMPKNSPLNVDEGLPLPEAGQASTVFSLTALFGAYFAIYSVLGLPALSGLAVGTVLGLFLIRFWVNKHNSKTFEDFLISVISGTKSNANIFVFFVAGIQFAYATSELVILREIARVLFKVRPDYANILVIAVAIIGYFYVLFGAYVAVYRTDVLQFFLVLAMGLGISILSVQGAMTQELTSKLVPRTGYWEAPFLHLKMLQYGYHFVLGAGMGLALLTASPDTWKRVFVITKTRPPTVSRFVIFVAVGIMPFLVILPFALAMTPIPNGPVDMSKMFSGLLANDKLLIAAALGLLGSFLSAFDSAILGATHIILMLQRKNSSERSEISRFHWIMAAGLITIFLLFLGLSSFNNPYILANLLLGPYAIIAGVQVATGALVSVLPERSLLWIFIVGFTSWSIYFIWKLGLPETPNTYQVNTVPGGICLFFLIFLVCYVLGVRSRPNVRAA